MIKTTHGDYEITYDEEDNFWYCPTLKVKAASLSALKAKVAKMDADLRRLPSVAVLYISGGISGARDGYSATLLDDDGASVWVTTMPVTGARKREKFRLNTLALATTANRQAVEEAVETCKRAMTLQKRAAEMFAAIPRVTAEELRGFSDQWEEAHDDPDA